MVMVSNQTNAIFGYLAGRFPGGIGHMYSPGGQRGPWHFFPFAIDNGAWPAFKNGKAWDEADWKRLLLWTAMRRSPLWAIVPDCVGDRAKTMEMWDQHNGEIRRYGFRPAFAAQDGMTFDDVPDSDCVVFLGGSTDWKEAAIGPWCERFPGRVHVGRVNKWDRLVKCYRAGAVSVDGTGWFHHKQRAELEKFFYEVRS